MSEKSGEDYLRWLVGNGLHMPPYLCSFPPFLYEEGEDVDMWEG